MKDQGQDLIPCSDEFPPSKDGRRETPLLGAQSLVFTAGKTSPTSKPPGQWVDWLALSFLPGGRRLGGGLI